MQKSLAIGVSAQTTLLRRLDTLAGNIANQATAGYRAEEVTFSSALSTAANEPVAFPTVGQTYSSRRLGEIKETGNKLDIAVSGEGWLSVKTPAGIALTRDGRLRVAASGELQTVTGYPVLDAGGSPVQLNPAGGAPSIAKNGAISQDGRSVGVVGTFLVPPDTKFKRLGDTALLPSVAPVPSTESDSVSIMQGYLERSNVEPVREISRMIDLQRTFDSIASTMSQLESSLNDSIKTLGGS